MAEVRFLSGEHEATAVGSVVAALVVALDDGAASFAAGSGSAIDIVLSARLHSRRWYGLRRGESSVLIFHVAIQESVAILLKQHSRLPDFSPPIKFESGVLFPIFSGRGQANTYCTHLVICVTATRHPLVLYTQLSPF